MYLSVLGHLDRPSGVCTKWWAGVSPNNPPRGRVHAPYAGTDLVAGYTSSLSNTRELVLMETHYTPFSDP